MFDKILLPLDGSEVAEMALPYGEEMARGLGAELVLLHVRGQERQQEYGHIHQIYLDRLAETVRHNVGKGPSVGKAVRVTTKVAAGDPTETICNLVEKNDVSLVIMASVSASGLRIGKTLGSVADQVCRVVPVPVMLIRPQNIVKGKDKERLISRLLVPLDGSDLSKLALPISEELSRQLKAKITLFRMSTTIIPYVGDGGATIAIDYSKFDKAEEERVRAEISVLEQEMKQKGFDVSSSVISGFDAAGEIIDAAKKTNADLVVMSTHGRSGLGRWVFGNVAERVLRHGETPLLLVHAKAS